MGSVGKSQNANSFGSGVTTVQQIPVEDFNYWDTRYGKYTYELANDINSFSEYPILKLTMGRNTAYAGFDQETDTLEGIISTGGGTGTELLIRIIERQAKNNKSLNWLADNPQSLQYYKNLGLAEFALAKNDRNSSAFYIPENRMAEVLRKLKNRRRK